MSIKQVIVSLDVPFGLMWNDETIEVNMGRFAASVIIKKIFVKDGKYGSFEGCELPKDRQGRSSFSKFDCILQYEGEINDEIYFRKAIEVVNRILMTYRNFYDEFHIDKIRDVDILNYSVNYIDCDNKVETHLTISFRGSGGLSLARCAPVHPDIRNILKTGLEFPLWKNALNNAKNNFDLEDYKEAIIEANIALENFVYIHVYDRLKGIIPEEEVENLLTFNTPCEKCEFQKDQAKKHIIEPFPPSIHKVIIFMYQKVPIQGFSITGIRKIVSNITRHRNEIVHGRSSIEITRRDAEIAITSLDELIQNSFIALINP